MVKTGSGRPRKPRSAKVDGHRRLPTFVRDIGGGWVAMSLAEDPTNFQPGGRCSRRTKGARSGGRADRVRRPMFLSMPIWMRVPILKKSIDKAPRKCQAWRPAEIRWRACCRAKRDFAKLIGPFEQVARVAARDAQACVARSGWEKRTFVRPGGSVQSQERDRFFNSTGNADGTVRGACQASLISSPLR